ncbi:hypothetical protein AUEXF2481DRAFT_468709 [Aureobasidium subglaciale EXF-2481]|uniref:Uncharacterized protein n=1 Tax=Aureobasidium subglaciale (strain EXF-2481) TaxID=1043005 RepID=A0A074ZHQ7_AURSE|nr:uncharacterized protein AUEXF2481DRAFT_468709 [Aureobasidium subglaciale EXF-2481]KEQ98096.1 hypothetical protein AUEXF2481DRAFT_468709 [Aureobasidium subglaciale EXF-2481]
MYILLRLLQVLHGFPILHRTFLCLHKSQAYQGHHRLLRFKPQVTCPVCDGLCPVLRYSRGCIYRREHVASICEARCEPNLAASLI